MNTPKILAFSGSTRTGSYNQQLVTAAAEFARAAGATVTVANLRDFALPLFDQDLEAAAGMPAGAKQFKTLLREHDGFLIASPEYNSSFTPALKNALDWASRAETQDEPPLAAYRGKVAALISASPGALGGLRGLVQLRAVLGNIGVIVLPEQAAVGAAHEVLDEAGRIKDERKAKQVGDVARSLAGFLAKLKA